MRCRDDQFFLEVVYIGYGSQDCSSVNIENVNKNDPGKRYIEWSSLRLTIILFIFVLSLF